MHKRIRQYTGLLVAILSYYLIHEGAHFLYAFVTGTFRQVNILGLGVQIDVFRENMTDLQLGLFCLAGSLSTTITACALVLLTDRICAVPSRMLKACMYYTTIGMLLIDPLYLSILCGFFGLLLVDLSARGARFLAGQVKQGREGEPRALGSPFSYPK